MATIPKGSRRSPWSNYNRKPGQRQGEQDKRYWSRTWKKARNAFIRENPTCATCGQLAAVVDHIEPARLGTHDFYDTSNWQALCTHCHAVKSGKERWG